MNTKSIFSLTILLLTPALLRAQGTLTPPAGLPVASMKTLDQVEARTAVNKLTGDATALFVISSSGSYYLTGPIAGFTGKSGIRIDATDVTLDLNGFQLTGTGGATNGVQVTSTGGSVSIRNGKLKGWPGSGVKLAAATSFLLEDLSVSAGQIGIDVNGSGLIQRVVVNGVSNWGILGGTITRCTILNSQVENVSAFALGGGGIKMANALISGCSVQGIASDDNDIAGIEAAGGVVENCTVTGITLSGLSTATGIRFAEQVRNCIVGDISASFADPLPASAWGISSCGIVTQCTVKNISSSSGKAAVSSTAGGLVTGCRVYGSSTGIDLKNGSEACGNVVLSCPTGINCDTNAVIANNTISSSTGTGIFMAAASRGRVEGNQVSNCGTGISSTSATSLVLRNTAGANTTNYTLHASQVVVSSSAPGTNPNANIAQ